MIISTVHTEQKGIALIQVLLLTGILTVLLLYFTQTARQQVALANYANQRAQALVNMHTAKNQILFRLLTEQKLEQNSVTNQNETDSINWNFYGEPFAVAKGVTATLQDQSGLLSAHFLDTEIVEQILLTQRIAPAQVTTALQRLLDWQDIDTLTENFAAEQSVFAGNARNGHMPDLTDVIHITGINNDLYNVLQQILTIHYAGRFNPMTAPDLILKSLVTEDVYKQVNNMRTKAPMSKQTFSMLTGINEDDYFWFTPSNFLRLTINSQQGQVNVSQSYMILVNPYASVTNPINYLESRG
ncbi:MAG: general secretion pathway protein K [Paraglaciecola sp.]|jgi:general secretion pathway protein K